MEDPIGAIEYCLQAIDIQNIPLDKLQSTISFALNQVVPVSSIEIVEDNDLIHLFLQQLFDDVRTDESRTADGDDLFPFDLYILYCPSLLINALF